MASRLGRNPFIKHSKPQDILRSTRYLGQKKLSSKINFQAGNAHIQNKSYFFDRQRTFCKVTCYHSSSYAKAKSRYYLMSIYPLIFLTYVSSSNEIKDTSYKEEDNSKQPIFAEEMTMFLEAVVHNDLSIVKDSIKNGSYVNQMNNKKQTALHLSNSLDMISYLSRKMQI